MTPGSEAQPATTSPQPPAFMRRLWERMAAAFPHRWTSAVGVSPQAPDGSLTVAGDTWARGLSGITPDQLGQGLKACAAGSDGWPPSLPEFRAMCLGIPSLAQVRLEMRPGAPDVSRFTRLVYLHLDAWALRHADSREADRMVREAYGIAYDHVARGGELSEAPVAAVEHAPTPPKPADPAVAAEAIRKVRQSLGLEPAEASP